MAIAYSSPAYSFVDLNVKEDVSCFNEVDSCLPVNTLTDLRYQVLASVTGADKDTFPVGQYVGCITVPDVADVEEEWTPTWTKIKTGAGSDPDIWVGIFTALGAHDIFSNLDCNTCFSISIYLKLEDESPFFQVAWTKNCFYKECETCFTVLMRYGNNENAFGFYYPSGITSANSVRLRMYLHSPTNAEDKMIYEKSNGSTVLTSYRLWKDYKFKTDWMPDSYLEKLVVATGHDYAIVYDEYANLTASEVVRMEKMEVDWMEEDTPTWRKGMGKGTLRLAAPRANVNSNCNNP